jgi:hypothetical protein
MWELFAQERRAAPLNAAVDIPWQGIRVSANEQVDVIGLDRQSHDLPPVLCRYLPHELLQAVPHWPNQHPAAPLGTPDDVVHRQVDVVSFVLVVHVDIVSFFNSARKAEGPFIRRLKPGAFWPILGNRLLSMPRRKHTPMIQSKCSRAHGRAQGDRSGHFRSAPVRWGHETSARASCESSSAARACSMRSA